MASTFISRSASSTGNRRTWTFSAWVKKCRVSNADATQMLFGTYTDSSNRLEIGFHNANNLVFKEKSGGSTTIDFTSTALFKDPNAWYHIVVKVDTTQSTESNRVKIYSNGSQITDWVDDTYPSQNYDTFMNLSGRTYTVGQEGNNSYYFDGSMTHVHLTDGYAYDASTFGQTDSVSGIWKPKTSPSVTYGTNGFFLKFENSAAMGTDSSGNSNTFAVSGSLTQNVDTPSNNFAYLNRLQGVQAGEMGLLEGNLYLSGNSSSQWRAIGATVADNSGKYYWEGKCIGNSGGVTIRTGICDAEQLPAVAGTKFSQQSRGWGINTSGNVTNNDSTVGGWTGTSWTTNDILMFAMDLTNSKFYIGKNGTWMNSGDPTSGSTGTGALSITSGYYYTPAHENYDAAANFAYNFGNGYFRTTAISSEGTNASGIGKFEYDVPTGYTALSTKGLNE